MAVHRAKKKIIPLPFHFYFIPVLIITISGLIDSIYLFISHYRVYTDIGYKSFCAISRALNCDTVSQSPYSILFNVPVPVWGIFGYLFFLIILIFAGNKSAGKIRIWTFLIFISLGFSVYSIVLAGISTFLIHSYCIMCILSYGVNFLLLYFSWIIWKRFKQETFLKSIKFDFHFLLSNKLIMIIGGVFVICTAIIIAYFPDYWNLKPPIISKAIPSGMTQEGYPWIGSENPELTITEFSDYLCFQCKKMNFYLRQLIEKYPHKIRLIHRNFPMDKKINPIVNRPFHEGSAKLALLAIYASEKGKFWKMNDIIYNAAHQKGPISLRNLAGQAGLDPKKIKSMLRNKALWIKLRKDIRAGLAYGLVGTPGFIIDGKVYQGQIPSEILNKVIE